MKPSRKFTSRRALSNQPFRQTVGGNGTRGGGKVAKVETFLVNGEWRNFLIVKITTHDGVVGWGDGSCGWKEFPTAQMIQELAERYVVGMDPFRIEDFWFKCYQVEHQDGPVMFSAMAGIETALWDIVGKISKQPVVNLVGGKIRDKVKAYANGWYSSVHDQKRLRKQVDSVLALGYRALKFDPFGAGGREIDKTELRRAKEIVRSVRKAVGPDIEILIECHGRFSVGMAIEAIKAMQEFEPMFCEEPIPARNHKSQGWVCQAASAMGSRVATGEHCYSKFGFEDLMERQGAHVIQPDLVFSGGFMETKKIAAMAEARYISVAPHNCNGPGQLAATIHLCANISNFLIMETFQHFDVPWRKDITYGEPEFKDGYYSVPSKPGWGIDFNEKEIRKHPGSPDCKMNMWADDWEKLMCK